MVVFEGFEDLFVVLHVLVAFLGGFVVCFSVFLYGFEELCFLEEF